MSGFGVLSLDFGEDDGDEDGIVLDDLDPTVADPEFDWTPEDGDEETAGPPAPPTGDVRAEEPLIAPGVNLVPHSSFESSRDWSVGAGWTVPFADGDAFHGGSVAQYVGTVASELASARIPIDPTLPYWATAWGWVQSGSGWGRMLLRQFDAADALLEETVIEEQSAAVTTWDRMGREFRPRRQDSSLQTAWQPDVAAVRIALVAEGITWQVDAVWFGIGDIPGAYAPAPNEGVPGDEVLPGTLPPVAFDTTPPAVPVIATVRTTTDPQTDGTFLVSLRGALVAHPTDSDYAGCEWQATSAFDLADPDDPLSAKTPDWDRPVVTFQSPAEAEAVFVGVRPATAYWVRARSRDVQGNRSAWCSAATIVSGADGEAPEVPSAPGLSPILKGLVATWGRNAEPDIGVYEVRYRRTGTTEAWVTLRTRGTVMVLSPLIATEDKDGNADTGYDVQVRAIDTSNQVQTSDTDPTPVDATAFDEAGWSDTSVGYPSLTKGGDIAAATITGGNIRAGTVTTDRLASGEILINTTDDQSHPDGISVRLGAGDDAPEVMRIDEDGISVWADEEDHGAGGVFITGGSITMVDNGSEVVGITPEGISATALRLGVSPGGHNLIFNSSFEVSDFVGDVVIEHTASGGGATQWGAATRVGSNDNTSEGTSLTITTGTYA